MSAWPPSDRIDAILACLRRETTYEAVAAKFGVTPEDVQRWEASFISGGAAALRKHQAPVVAGTAGSVGGQTDDTLRRRISQLELVQSITARAIEDLTEQTVLSFAAQATCAVLDYAGVGIGLIAGERLALTTATANSPTTPTAQLSEIPLDRATVIGSVALDNRLIRIDDLSAANYTPLALVSRSLLAVPIRYKGKALGAISVESGVMHAFDDTDVATITLLADQLTIAIRGARLFQQTQAQLREISLFRRLADEAIVGVVTRDLDGILDYSNPAAAAMFGFDDPAEMRGLSIRSLYPDDSWYEIDKQLCIRAMRDGGWSGEVTQRRQNGEPLVIDMSIFPIYAPDGAFLTYATVLMNATERRRLLDMVQQSNARFEAILAATDDGIIVWDEFWRVLIVNAAASRMLGAAPEDLVGRTREELGNAQPMVAATANAPEDTRIELAGPERRMGRFRNLRWHSDKASGHLTVIYDITSQVELEESREDITSMLLHDLLGPLTSIVGGIEMVKAMLAEGESQERLMHFLDMASRNVSILLDMASSLLDITQLESGRISLTYTPLQPDRLIEEVSEMLASMAQTADIAVSISCEQDLPPILADQNMVRRALANLLDNALKFTPGGGQVTISARREDEHAICFSVVDTGPGIPEAYRRRIFEKYVQVPDQTGRRHGKGLGLVFCRLVAEAHGGRIWIEPQPGGGSIFLLTIAGAVEQR
jgi:PAS domain S-box-containing protein